MVEILASSYAFIQGVISALPAPLYWFIQLFFGSVLLSAFLYVLRKIVGD